ncbi:hypothetical protein M0R45_022980 [Rubus argutus]|uniref:Uncharacterized protein n=1 Tax=Rubus argutus TaxID=59490 RepID=A0AAW1WQX0_RUBAR
MYPNRRRKAQLCRAAAAVAAYHTRAQQVRSDLLHHQRFLLQLATPTSIAVVPLSRCTHHHLTASPPARALADVATQSLSPASQLLCSLPPHHTALSL